jgi:hypothetical protein
MFPTAPEAGYTPLVLEINGITVPYKKEGKDKLLRGVPSFKTGKTAFAWKDKVSGKIMARPVTLPEHKKWMELATRAIECQLRSAFQITDAKIRTVAQPRSWIASLMPLDDSWTWIQELIVNSRLCLPGEEEGATIEITRLS